MLVLSRRTGEKIMLGDNICLTVVAVQGKQVRLGFEAPAGVNIRRQELPCPTVRRSARVGVPSGQTRRPARAGPGSPG